MHYFKHPLGSEEFRLELEQCRAGAMSEPLKTDKRMRPGSISALIGLYFGTPEFTGLRPLTQKTYRSTLERFREAHGDKRVAGLKRTHIKVILGKMAETPAAANNLLDRLRTLMRLAVDEEWRADDPTVGLKGFSQKTEGFHSWTEDELAAYEARHPLGTKARLAFDLLLYTNQRKGDVVTLGRQHRAGNAHRITQQKTGKALELEIVPELEASIAAAVAGGVTGDLTYLVTGHGRPFTANGFGNWFRERCDEAGLGLCSAHGLRKAGLRRMAESGNSNPQMKSVSGHSGDKEVAVYTAAANQRKMARVAVGSLRRPKPES